MARSKNSVQAAKNRQFSKKEAINFGFEVAKKNIFFFIPLFVVVILTYAVLGFFQMALQDAILLSIVASLVRFIVGMMISMGLIKIALEFVGKKKPKLSDVFYKKSLLNFFLVSVVNFLIVFVGFLLLIIPGIIFSIKLQFASYLVVDKGKGVVEALSGSWEMTKGVKWNLFLFWILLALINILGALCLLVGLLITVPLSMVATAYVYRKLLS